jgi:hypothetical protein
MRLHASWRRTLRVTGRRSAKRAGTPTSKRSAAGGRSGSRGGWAATAKTHPRIRAQTLHRTVAVRNDGTAETSTAFR